MIKSEWNSHYKKNKSVLSYPDENLVRLVARELNNSSADINAIDIGCGSGRHLALLENFGVSGIYGTDYSYNALDICKKAGYNNLVNCDNTKLPFTDGMFDIAIAWGSLHYSTKEQTALMAGEIRRILKTNGSLFATLRRDNDTYLKTGTHLGNNTWNTGLNDLSGTVASFFSIDEVKGIFINYSDLRIGWMERTIVGDTEKVISHWIISAKR